MGGNSWLVVLKDVGCEEDEEADDDSAILELNGHVLTIIVLVLYVHEMNLKGF
jgi:hypothetical protein